MKARFVQVLFSLLFALLAITIYTANATTHNSPNKEDISAIVTKLAAEQFGVDESEINQNTALQRDLLADQMDIYRLVALACDAYGRKLEKIENITTIADVVEFVFNAPLEEIKITKRGSDQTNQNSGIAIKRIYFATDRQAQPEQRQPKLVFNGIRSSTQGKLNYGYCDVSVPASHQPGELELPLLAAFSNPKHHFELHSLELLKWDLLIESIKETISSNQQTNSNDLLLFVHGYNVTFENAALRTAQISVDLGFPGITMLYSWPSDGRLTSYFSDREDAEWSAAHLDQLLIDLVENKTFGKLHLVAHSMGSQALLRAIHRIALREEFESPLFENIILAAPDFDAQTFTEQMAQDVQPIANSWTLYTSQKDLALYASRLVRQSITARLGEPLPLLPGVDTVDASEIEVSPWSLPENHSYYATKQRVIRDLKGLLQGKKPDVRGLNSQILGNIKYWQIVSN